MSDLVKHRIVGALVVVSLMVIFLPAILKKSNHNFEKNIKLALKLPNKPALPKIEEPSNRELFNSVNVVKPKKISVNKINKSSLIAKAMPLEIKNMPAKVSNIVSIDEGKFNNDKSHIKVASNSNKLSALVNPQTLKAKESIVKIANTTYINKETTDTRGLVFSIQVATFTKKNNADILVSKLKTNGFYAASNEIKKSNGVVLYQVIVGKVTEREAAEDLQKKLASMMQLKGFIVKSEVS